MNRATEYAVALGDTGLHAALSIRNDAVTRIRLTMESRASGEMTASAVSGSVIEALRNWPDAGRAVDWLDDPAFPPIGTAFQRRVWRALCALAVGETVSYGEVAARIGQPGAARAVGQAVNANPWPPLVPCHRVLSAGGHLGGYALGTGIKRKLLRIEGVELET
ncbi:MAG: methylated-DNA--[protein]-cysteine S-methyltransferase [Guyparkeria sp.]|uniref:methylated-DNA--[protein]-cysteine S-methyltransferase n=1 Tax=Guyparkeria sp. TaxID=2035736 RepID=UPI00397C8EE4